MQKFACLLAITWGLWSAPGDLEGQTARLAAPSIHATIDHGTITAIRPSASDVNLLRSAVAVEIISGTKPPIEEASTTLGTTFASSHRATAERTNAAHGLSWTHKWEISDDTLTVRTTFMNLTDKRRCVGIRWRFALVGTDCKPFFSGSFLSPEWPDSKTSWYSYLTDQPHAHRLNIPFWTIYSPGRDVGVTLAADLAPPILPFGVRVDRVGNDIDLTVTRPQIRLEAHGSNTVTLYVTLHAGDWRRGLAWLRDRWPEQFYVEPHVEQYQNQTYGGTSTTADWRFGHASNLERMLAERLPRDSGTVDFRIFPWWGLHFPDEEPFLISVDSKWHYWKQHPETPGHPGLDADYRQIVSFLNAIEMTDELQARIRAESGGVAPDFWDYETFTREKVRQKVKARAEHGMKSIQYLDVSEAWHPWAHEELQDSLFLPDHYSVGGAIGQLESTTAIALPGSSWEKSLLGQARNVLKHYPQMSGMFLDQVYYDLSDRIHDDGISIGRDGKPFARQHWALAQVMQKIKEMLAAQKKIMVINQAWNSIEIGSIGDLMLCEGGGRGLIRLLESLKYFGIGNRLSFDQVPFEDEAHDCLRYGWYMNLWTDPGDYQNTSRFTRLRFCRAYYPLFELLRGRTWVLEPHCLDLPDGLDGNLFRRPDGAFVATVVTPNASSASPWTRTHVPVTVRVEDAADVKAAYVLTANLLGPRRIDFERMGHEIIVNLPRHRAASAVLLVTSGRFLSTPNFGLTPGHDVQLRLDNFTTTPWSWRGTISLGSASVEQSVTVEPGESQFIAFPADDVPQRDGHGTFAVESATRGVIPAIDPDQAPTPSSTFELVVEPAVTALIAPPPTTVVSGIRERPWEMHLFVQSRVDLVQGDQQVFQAAITNHLNRQVTLSPRFSAKGAILREASTSVVVPAGRTTAVTMTLEAQTPGPGHVTFVADGPDGPIRATLPFNVIATAHLANVRVKNVRLAADVFYTGSGNPPVTLNGVKVGPFFSEWTPHPYSWYSAGTQFLLGEAAISAVAETNEVRLDPPAGMLLKIRNLALVLNYEDGRTAILPANPKTQTAADDASLAEGKYVPRGQFMAWQCPAAP